MIKTQVRCFKCDRSPEDFVEYKNYKRKDETNTEFVIREDGTYNPANGHYACDSCYITIGSPAKEYPGWKAP